MEGGMGYSLDRGWREGIFPGPLIEGGGVPWALYGERRYSTDAGWMEGIFPGPWMEGWTVLWASEEGRGVPLTLEEGWAILRNTG